MAAARRAHTMTMASRKSARKRPVILAGSRPSGRAGCEVCLEAHGKPLLDEGATRAQLAEGGYSHRLDERLFGAAPVYDLLLEDVDERAVSSVLLGAGRLDGARWEVLHLGDAGLQSFQGAFALRLSRGLGEGVRNGGVKEEFVGAVAQLHVKSH